MKTSFTIIAVTVLLITSLSSFATIKHPSENSATKRVLSTYLETVALGNFVYHKSLFAEDYEYRNSANNKAYNKKQFVKFLKDTKDLKFDCTTTYEVLDECDQACVGKIVMQFKEFTRIDYITLIQTDKGGWLINKVMTTYM